MTRTVHPIEARSYRLLREAVDTAGLPPCTRDVVERIVHTTADSSWLADLVPDEAALEAGRKALRDNATLVVDAMMVAAGITTYPSVCLLNSVEGTADITRSAAAIREAAETVGKNAVWAIGNAPTALEELLRHDVEPALVIGLPVGYVGAVEAKEALRAKGWPALTNRSARGGSAVAAAAVNALLYGDPLA